MMKRYVFAAIFGALVALWSPIVVLVTASIAQPSAVAVSPSSGFDAGSVLIILLIAAGIAAFIWLQHHKNSKAAQVASEAVGALKGVANDLSQRLHQSTPATPTAGQPAASGAPSPTVAEPSPQRMVPVGGYASPSQSTATGEPESLGTGLVGSIEHTLYPTYIDRDDFMKDMGIDFPLAVRLDGRPVHNGAEPAQAYFTWADGSVRSAQPIAAAASAPAPAPSPTAFAPFAPYQTPDGMLWFHDPRPGAAGNPSIGPAATLAEAQLSYDRLTKIREPGMTAQDAADVALSKPGPIPPSIYPGDVLTMLALYKASGLSLRGGPGAMYYQLVAGTREQRGRIVNFISDEYGYPQANAFDYNSYNGPYRAVIDEYVAVNRA